MVRSFRMWSWLAVAALVVVATACSTASSPPPTTTPVPKATSVPTATATPPPTIAPSPTRNPLAGVPGIVDPTNLGWPRTVHGLNGDVTISQKPTRIVAMDVGHAEIAYALVPASEIVAVSSADQDPDYSNVAALAKSAMTVTRDPEQIIAQKPDIVLESPYAPADEIQTLQKAGIAVVQTDIHNDPQGRLDDILMLGYALGETQRAEQFAQEVNTRFNSIEKLTETHPTSTEPRVMDLVEYAGNLYTGGIGSTEGSIITAAGGVNVAAEAGLKDNPEISAESVIAMKPDVIVIPEPTTDGDKFKQELMSNPALAEVPAIKNGRVYVIPATHFTTLSFWNLLGVQDLAKILWPDQFASTTFPAFSMPGG